MSVDYMHNALVFGEWRFPARHARPFWTELGFLVSGGVYHRNWLV